MTHSSKFWILVSAATVVAIVLLWFVLYLIAPPFFVEAGRHYFGGPDIWSVSGVYHCEVPGPDCVPVRETWAAALANDPNIANWWPVRISTVEL